MPLRAATTEVGTRESSGASGNPLRFIGLAQVIDIAASSRAFAAVEEVLELNAAILLAFYVVQQGWAAAGLPRNPHGEPVKPWVLGQTGHGAQRPRGSTGSP